MRLAGHVHRTGRSFQPDVRPWTTISELPPFQQSNELSRGEVRNSTFLLLIHRPNTVTTPKAISASTRIYVPLRPILWLLTALLAFQF